MKTRNLNDDALDARLIPRKTVKNLGRVTVRLPPANIHPHQHLSPILRLSAPGAGLNLKDSVPFVALAGKKRVDLHVRDYVVYCTDFICHFFENRGIVLRGAELGHNGGVLEPPIKSRELLHSLCRDSPLLHKLLRGSRVRPQVL